MTITRIPRVKLSATFSAAWRHTLQDRKRLSPSFHSPVELSRKRGVEATLRAYRSVCGDAAEFFRELRDSDAKPSDRGPLSPGVTAALQSSQGDTLAALDAVGAAMGGLDTSGSEVLLAPIVNTLHADRSALSQAHHDENELARAVNETP